MPQHPQQLRPGDGSRVRQGQREETDRLNLVRHEVSSSSGGCIKAERELMDGVSLNRAGDQEAGLGGGKGRAGDGQGVSGAAGHLNGTVLENEKRFLGLTGVSLFPLKGGPERCESQVEVKEARSQAGRLAQGDFTTQTTPATTSTQRVLTPHTPGPRDGLLAHTHTHTYTSHTQH